MVFTNLAKIVSSFLKTQVLWGGGTVLSDSTGSQIYTRVGPSLSRDHSGVFFGRDDTENDFKILSHKFVLLLLYIYIYIYRSENLLVLRLIFML